LVPALNYLANLKPLIFFTVELLHIGEFNFNLYLCVLCFLPRIAKPGPNPGRLVKPVPAKADIGAISLDVRAQKVN
jgi:hypothetical protein